MSHNRVWAEIDLDAIENNLAVIRARVGVGTRIMLIVKADAYGHGAVGIAHHAIKLGVSALGVGTSAEALELRDSGIRVPILVLGTVVDEEVSPALRQGIDIGIHSSDRVQKLEQTAKALGLRARVHLNVDTGMGRLGVLPESAVRLLQEIQAAEHLELAGIMSHISAPDGALNPRTLEQSRAFESVLRSARAKGLVRGWIHLANSASIFTDLQPAYDTVRPGISAYGVLPAELSGSRELQPVMSLLSRIVFLKDVPAGTPIGYDSTWTARHDTRIATLPLGYNDGVSWRLGNRGEVVVRGQRAPIIGRVSMDYITLDVSHIRDVAVDDHALLFGRAQGTSLSVAEVARKADTIPYEITCSVGKRVARVFVGGQDAFVVQPFPVHSVASLPRKQEQRAPAETPSSLPLG